MARTIDFSCLNQNSQNLKICNDSGQPQGIAPTSEYFRNEPMNIVVGAILYGCPESLQKFSEFIR